MNPHSPRITVAIPLFNEESNVATLVARVLAVLDRIDGGPHQLLIVNDGSRDRTLEHLEKLADCDPRLTVIDLSRNFGHQAALSAALDHAEGDAIALMDGDLQDPPEALPQLLEELNRGSDVVYAVRAARKESWLLRFCYRTFYRLITNCSRVSLPLDAGDFCVMRRNVVEVLRQTRECHRYLRGLRAWAGFRQSGVVVARGARHSGQSKYTWRKRFSLAFDGLFSFSTLPLRTATTLGIVTTGLAVVLGLFWIAAKLLGYAPQGFTALAVSITFFGGVQLLFTGIVGEYVGRIYDEVKRRPLYVVRQILGGTESWTRPTAVCTANSTSGTGGGVRAKSLSLTQFESITSLAPATVSSTSDAAMH